MIVNVAEKQDNLISHGLRQTFDPFFVCVDSAKPSKLNVLDEPRLDDTIIICTLLFYCISLACKQIE